MDAPRCYCGRTARNETNTMMRCQERMDAEHQRFVLIMVTGFGPSWWQNARVDADAMAVAWQAACQQIAVEDYKKVERG